MTNEGQSSKDEGDREPLAYDLEERTAKFAEAAIDFAKQLPVSPVTMKLIDQFIRSSTSIGANYCEAQDAESKKDFRHKIAICRKESRETKYWLRLIGRAADAQKVEARRLWQEAKELNLIFAAIYRNSGG